MDKPVISIIIPVFNHREEIGPCLDSIYRQTFSDYEIIVVNDGSTDAFDAAIAPHLNKIKLINQENRGANAARNRGFDASSGDYVIFCDADVQMSPDMLDAMLQSLKDRPEYSYAYSSFRFGFKLFKLFPFNDKRLGAMNFIHTTSLIRRFDFPRFDENITRFQDWDLWLTMLKNKNRGWWIDEVLFTIKPRHRHNMSEWLPSFAYWKFFGFLPSVQKYRAAEKIIKQKHKLP
ncbi:MAG: glycosyltransferase family A protein [Patescibacteria group bacterium]|nr:glycosyltransferase family A protein [Patescibacteria group bacterium]